MGNKLRTDLPNGNERTTPLSSGRVDSTRNCGSPDGGVIGFAEPLIAGPGGPATDACSECKRPLWLTNFQPDDPEAWLSEVPLHTRLRYRPFLIDDVSGYSRELKKLAQLEFANPSPDVRKEAFEIASHPGLVAWLGKSDALLDSPDLKCRADLAKFRRRGTLRHIEGPDRGFPLFQPPPPPESSSDKGFWMLRLRDELSWLVLRVYRASKTRPFARPVKERLNHTEARAILDWKASHLDLWLSKKSHLFEGRIAIEGSRGVLFDTERFMRWVYANTN